jgi:magnesium chelatase family protein
MKIPKTAHYKYPCPCGYFGDPVKACTCSAGTVTKYQKRISGPLLDRIDIHIAVPRVEYEKLSDSRLGDKTSMVQERVGAARQIQRKRFEGTEVTCYADKHLAEAVQYWPRIADGG